MPGSHKTLHSFVLYLTCCEQARLNPHLVTRLCGSVHMWVSWMSMYNEDGGIGDLTLTGYIKRDELFEWMAAHGWES